MALNVFHGTTSAAIISYFPDETAVAEFLKLVNIWWTRSNSKSKFNANNRIGNAAIPDDRKAQFLRAFAEWVKEWRQLQISGCNKFTLTAQTSNILITTLEGTACLLEDLFSEGYQYVLTSRFQTDPLEKHFGKYRQMSGGRFLVSLREVQSTEKILCMKSLIKEDINSWDERVKYDSDIKHRKEEFMQKLSYLSNEIQESELCQDSCEVASNVAKLKCNVCETLLKSNKISSEYIKIMSRGGLTEPSQSLADYVCAGFAILDTTKDLLFQYSDIIKHVPLLTLGLFQINAFMCKDHQEWGRKLVNSIITNIFLNNEQSITNANIRNDGIATSKARQTYKR